MTVSALARYLRCHRSLIYRLLKERKIPAFRLGGDWRFFRPAIDEWIAQREIPFPPAGQGRKSKHSVNHRAWRNHPAARKTTRGKL
jgi:excisionase family DNA binding protein